jgi:hypothetical protein
VLPLAEPLRIEGCANLNIERLEEELRAEVAASGGVLVSPPVIAASSHLPG